MLDRALALVGAAVIGLVSLGALTLLAAVVSVARNPPSKTPVPPAADRERSRPAERVLVNVETERFHSTHADLEGDFCEESLPTALAFGFEPCSHCFDVVDEPEVGGRV